MSGAAERIALQFTCGVDEARDVLELLDDDEANAIVICDLAARLGRRPKLVACFIIEDVARQLGRSPVGLSLCINADGSADVILKGPIHKFTMTVREVASSDA